MINLVHETFKTENPGWGSGGGGGGVEEKLGTQKH